MKWLAPSLLLALAVSARADDVDRLPEWQTQAYALVKNHPPYDDESKYGVVVEWRLKPE